MALIPKTAINYRGVALPNAYMRVEAIHIEPRRRVASIVLNVYATKEDAADSANLIEQYHHTVGLAKFMDYFSVAKLDTANPLKRAYQYAMQLKKQADDGTETEENEYADWKADLESTE
jgi:hypothetical protein